MPVIVVTRLRLRDPALLDDCFQAAVALFGHERDPVDQRRRRLLAGPSQGLAADPASGPWPPLAARVRKGDQP